MTCAKRDDLWEEMTAHARGTSENRNDTDTGIDPDRPTTRGVVDDSACDAYSSFIGDAPDATSACFTGACARTRRGGRSASGRTRVGAIARAAGG